MQEPPSSRSPRPARLALPAAVALVLVACALPLLVGLAQRGPVTAMEAITLQTSQETWLRQRGGERNAWLAPTRNGQVRVRKPPLVVWANMLAWIDLDPAADGVAVLVRRARLVTVALALVMLLATFAIGRTLADDSLGLFAMAIAGTALLLQQQARLAAYDMHLAAWATLAVAAALAALGGRGPRAAAAWIGAAVALSLAWLSKGPIALVLFALPVGAAVALAPRLRWRGAVAAAGAMGGAFALVLPWMLHLREIDPAAAGVLRHEYGASLTNAQPLYYYPARLLRDLMPWTLWIIGGLCLPLLLPRAERPRRLWLPWLWLVLVVVVFTVPAGKAMRYVLAVVPAAALLAAGVLHHHQALADRGERDPGAWRLAVPHWGLLGVISLVPLLLPALAAPLRARGLAPAPETLPSWTLAGAAGAVMLALVGAGAVASRRFRPRAVLAATVGWMIAASSLYWHLDARHETTVERLPGITARIDALIGASELRYLRLAEDDFPCYDLLLHLRRIVPAIAPGALGRPDADFVLTRGIPEQIALLEAAGYAAALEFEDGHDDTRIVWARAAQGPAPGRAASPR